MMMMITISAHSQSSFQQTNELRNERSESVRMAQMDRINYMLEASNIGKRQFNFFTNQLSTRYISNGEGGKNDAHNRR